MKSLVLALALVLPAASAFAQRHKLGSINAETPEGQMLQQIGQESDETKKLALLEEFVSKFPKHEGVAWVYSQMQPLYVKTKQYDKAIDIGGKLIAMDPEDVEFAYQTLQAAVAKKDIDGIKKWAVMTSDIARKVAASAQPKDEDEVEAWKQRVDFAKQVDVRTEYELFTAAQTADASKKGEFLGVLEQRNPQSQYIPQLREQTFFAYVQAKDMERAVALAEKIPEKDQSEVMLLVAADYHLNKKEYDKAIAYCDRIVTLMNGKPKPANVSDADWEKAKANALGRAQWMAGVAYMSQGKLVQADHSFRAALPQIQGEPNLLAEALFHLGVANYRLGDSAGGDQARIMDAFKFTKECAAMRSRFQATAQKNLQAMQNKYRIK